MKLSKALASEKAFKRQGDERYYSAIDRGEAFIVGPQGKRALSQEDFEANDWEVEERKKNVGMGDLVRAIDAIKARGGNLETELPIELGLKES